MNELKSFLNSLSTEEQRDFAKRCGTSIGYLRKVLSTGGCIGAELSVSIEKNSNGQVTRKSLHPNKWKKIWPELISVESHSDEAA
ncbi:YdaS family helix-turn-helix protein [Yersinia enterocolitica]|uniref:transcriptional regulator n=1 Tax=Yersinia enterocolitica TaxID=630 RepID=UPI001C66CB3D|nr:YdaS family helix-turn-helix protein [Yersinia enterocolitica]EKN4770493.1 helix-turn-helix domain-containing protein [Yersinia enterocolitica]EKN5956850.1 Cro/Cl family transcriptional regulator [Yersinia enterocolitica]MBW5870426.1 helix-turn-helix domain-containing protein [Yersinia enterocolitica]